MDLSALKAKIRTIPTSLKRLGTADVAEALIAAWAIEFLRLRRVGGFRPVEMIAISLLMVALQALIKQAGRRGQNGHRQVVVSGGHSQVDTVGYQRDLFESRRWKGHRRPKRYPH